MSQRYFINDQPATKKALRKAIKTFKPKENCSYEMEGITCTRTEFKKHANKLIRKKKCFLYTPKSK